MRSRGTEASTFGALLAFVSLAFAFAGTFFIASAI
jgi:hypothetical protein